VTDLLREDAGAYLLAWSVVLLYTGWTREFVCCCTKKDVGTN